MNGNNMTTSLDALLRAFESEDVFTEHLRRDIGCTKVYDDIDLPIEEKEAVAMIYVQTETPIKDNVDALRILATDKQLTSHDTYFASRMLDGDKSFYGIYVLPLATETDRIKKANFIRKQLEEKGFKVEASVSGLANFAAPNDTLPYIKDTFKKMAEISKTQKRHLDLNLS